ncbi:MAG: chorismate-binding protein, partial [Armatimonadetes bacterium]|nr:chorismate-binding protein [Armatimonadota bacterium]
MQSRHQWLVARARCAELRAERLSEVVPVLAEAERLANAGLWVLGMVSFEAGGAFEPVAGAVRAPGTMPLAWFRAYPVVHWQSEMPTPDGAARVGPLQPSITREAYDASFARVKELIAAGDLYQANLTFPLRGSFAGDDSGLAVQLWRRTGPGYGASLADDRWSIASASPELFFQLDGDRISCRPMKGTRPRGRWAEEDSALAEELAWSTKDRAENLMILDMVRNDLGRVAETGTVRVPERFSIERYPTVWQMTSTVVAQTHATVPELFAALFPSASVTGAPKRRTLAAIAELEAEPREVYCGAIGYLGPGRRAQFNVAIRTAVIDRAQSTLRYDVGSGVVWDSTLDGEWDECLVKARTLTEPGEEFDLLETLRWRPGEGYFLLDLHLERLWRSAHHFGFVFDYDAVFDELDVAAKEWNRPQRVLLSLGAEGLPVVAARPLDAS